MRAPRNIDPTSIRRDSLPPLSPFLRSSSSLDASKEESSELSTRSPPLSESLPPLRLPASLRSYLHLRRFKNPSRLISHLPRLAILPLGH